MRLQIVPLAAVILASACRSAPTAGPLGEGMGGASRVASVDTAHPPRSATIELDEPAHVAVLLVIPGHSATLLYPRDSATDNRFSAGQATIPLQVPEMLARRDTGLVRPRPGTVGARDSTLRGRTRRGSTMPPRAAGPVPPTASAFLLLVTSPQPLEYQRLIEHTAGVSIPTIQTEALNAVAKAVRATIAAEPRTISAYFQRVELARGR